MTVNQEALLVDQLQGVVHLISQKKKLSLFDFITQLLNAGEAVLSGYNC